MRNGNFDGAAGAPSCEPPELAFGHIAAAEIAAAVRGVLWRDLAVLALRVHAAWQLPVPSSPDAAHPPRPFDTQALNLARSMAGLGLAMKRLSARDVCEAPADTIVPATLRLLDTAFNRAVAVERGGSPAALPATPADEFAAHEAAMRQIERQMFPHQPDNWSDEARADVGLPPASPEARATAELAQARWVIEQQTRDAARLEETLAALAKQKTAEIEDRIPAASTPGEENGGNPGPFVPRRRR